MWSSGNEDLAKLERTVAGYQAESALAVYRQTRPDASVRDLLVALTSDHMFRIPAIRMAEVRQSAAPTFLYEFAWRSRAFGGALGATHSLEIPFAFDNLDPGGFVSDRDRCPKVWPTPCTKRGVTSSKQAIPAGLDTT